MRLSGRIPDVVLALLVAPFMALLLVAALPVAGAAWLWEHWSELPARRRLERMRLRRWWSRPLSDDCRFGVFAGGAVVLSISAYWWHLPGVSGLVVTALVVVGVPAAALWLLGRAWAWSHARESAQPADERCKRVAQRPS